MSCHRTQGVVGGAYSPARPDHSSGNHSPPGLRAVTPGLKEDALTPAEREIILDVTQIILDLAGVFDPTPISDGTNAAISFARGDNLGGLLSVISIVPFLGDLAKTAKLPEYVRKLSRAVDAAKNSPRLATTLAPLLARLDGLLAKLVKAEGPVSDMAKRLREPIRRFFDRPNPAGAAARLFRSGMLQKHFQAVLQVARENKLIIVFRDTNTACLKYINRGFPPKPISIKAKTDDVLGLVTAKSNLEINSALNAGYWVATKDGKIMRSSAGGKGFEIVDFPGKPDDWPLAEGVIIHPNLKQPFTGDYDLAAVIDPKDLLKNASGTPVGGRGGKNISNPFDDEVIRQLNRKMGENRVEHGSFEHFGSLKEAKGMTIFYPDGKSTLHLAEGSEEAANFARELASHFRAQVKARR